MINKPTQQTNSTNQMQILEIRLRQDISARKKVLKWTKSIETRIEQTRAQLENFKQHKQFMAENIIQFKPLTSKIPIPSKLVQKTQRSNESNLPKPTTDNRDKKTYSNKVEFNDGPKSKINLQNCTIKNQTETIHNQNKTDLNNRERVNLTLSSSINNFIDIYIQKRCGPLFKRLESLELHVNLNECLIQEMKTNVSTISKNIDVNAKEFENHLNNFKNILIDYSSKNIP